MRVVHIPTADIIVPAGRRPVDPDKVKQIAESIEKIGMLMPITVGYEDSRIRLVAGAHRLAAAQQLGLSEVPAVVVLGDDIRLRLIEIAENLHRNELKALERDELLAEWIRLTEAKREVSSQSETKPQGGRPEGGINAAARELGISKADAHRAVKVAALSPEAKQAARDTGLDDNRTALLEAAKRADPEKQVEAIRERRENATAGSKSTEAGDDLSESVRLAAKNFGVSPDAVLSAIKVIKSGNPDLIAAVEGGKMSVSYAADVAGQPSETQHAVLRAIECAKPTDAIRAHTMRVMTSSDSPEWYSPPHIVEIATVFLGAIDLDPSWHPASPVKAAITYTKADDGLSREWHGKVYLNPPYGREIDGWIEKLVAEHEAGNVTEAIALLPARTDTEWWRRLDAFPRCERTPHLRELAKRRAVPECDCLPRWARE